MGEVLMLGFEMDIDTVISVDNLIAIYIYIYIYIYFFFLIKNMLAFRPLKTQLD